MVHKQNANINKGIGTIEENQTKNLKLNNTIIELKENQQKYSPLYLTKQKKESSNSKIDHLKLFSQGSKKEKRMKKSRESLRELWNMIMYIIMEVQE